MGNVDACMSDANLPVTVERLEYGVRQMDAKEVLTCIEGGIDVNTPIDRQGHTVMDIFQVEHQQMLKECQSRGKSKDGTKMMINLEESAAAVLQVLRSHGAQQSGREACLRRST
mmetsp:Transcript_7196/g.26215  ORF Transcript_7196/g.26215 Transcript_7196/m.26215 type:complete len:114 (-) Transcript_7196:452-793(-)